MAVCAATILSLLRRWGTVSFPTPRVLGVDDWGFQRKHPTGTLLIDLERHQPVEVLLGSDEQVFADWLHTHPGVEVICRDRGASYLNGATQGAPQAQQVLDRWHVAKNLGEVLQKALGQRMSMLHQAAVDANAARVDEKAHGPSASTPTSGDPPLPSSQSRKPPRRKPVTLSPGRAWQLSTFEQVHALHNQGWSNSAIAHHLQLHGNTVRKYLGMEQFVDRRHHYKPSVVEPYRAYLEQRWSQGCTMIKILSQELQAQGFTGSYKRDLTQI